MIKLFYEPTENGTLKSEGNIIVDTLQKVKDNFLKKRVILGPENFVYKRGKLFYVKDGKAIKSNFFGYSNRKKYVLFGTHYYKRRFFLKKLY